MIYHVVIAGDWPLTSEAERVIWEAAILSLPCCLLGWLTAQAAQVSILAGIAAQNTLSDFWNDHYHGLGADLGLPRLMGGFSPEADRKGAYVADTLVNTMRRAWIGFGGAVLLILLAALAR